MQFTDYRKESQICVRSSDGQIVEERRCRTAALARYLASRPRSRVIVETCSEAFGVADAALLAGHEVRVVPSTWRGHSASGHAG